MKNQGIDMQKLDRKTLNGSFSNLKIPIRISCLKPNGFPAVISLWYIIIDGKIYCATQKTAKIVSYLNKNPICGFEIAADNPPYRGIRGEGYVKILDYKGQKILSILIEKYLGKKDSNLSDFLKRNSKTEIAIEIQPKNTINYDYSDRMKGI